MVKVPTGGRKKKLNASIAIADMNTATARPQTVETARMASSSVRATVVWFTRSSSRYRKTTPDTIRSEATKGKSRRTKRRGTAVF